MPDLPLIRRRRGLRRHRRNAKTGRASRSGVGLDAGPALACIGHGLLTISHLPVEQRKAWREMFDYYVFRLHGYPAEHIPPHAQGMLAKTSAPQRRSIKEFLIRTLSMR